MLTAAETCSLYSVAKCWSQCGYNYMVITAMSHRHVIIRASLCIMLALARFIACALRSSAIIASAVRPTGQCVIGARSGVENSYDLALSRSTLQYEACAVTCSAMSHHYDPDHRTTAWAWAVLRARGQCDLENTASAFSRSHWPLP